MSFTKLLSRAFVFLFNKVKSVIEFRYETITYFSGSLLPVQAKPLYISRALSSFYGKEIEIWSGFGPVGNIEKKTLGQ